MLNSQNTHKIPNIIVFHYPKSSYIPSTKAEQLKNELDTLRPLDGEREARIMQKFRLDWNYHSNNLEGNSLTYGETKALILFGITAQGKPLKDHFEITGHNEAINWILEIVRGETVLTKSFIRQIHTLLLKESSYKEAITPDGKPTRRKIEVGKYKSQPNHVITVTGETFYFATPEETPAKMHDLIEWFRKEKEKLDVNPIILAALFHYKFIRIHPFDDGNGRVARILMNFILMQFGFPPVIIKTEDKEKYYAVLRLADADELEPFIEYIAQNLVRSLEIMIKGAKGESIEEPDDLDKELAILERNFNFHTKKLNKSFNKNLLIEIFRMFVIPITLDFLTICEKFDRFYLQSKFKFLVNEENWEDFEKDTILKIIARLESREKTDNFTMDYNFSHFKYDGAEKSVFHSRLMIQFEDLKYIVHNPQTEIIYRKDYETMLTDEEIIILVNSEGERHKKHIEYLFEKLRKTN